MSLFYPLGNIKGCWGDFDSRPLVWGFDEKNIIGSALFVLENDGDYEQNCWIILEKLALIMDTKADDTLFYSDEKLNAM